MATRPPSSCTSRVNSGAPGVAGAASSFTHAVQLSAEYPSPCGLRRNW